MKAMYVYPLLVLSLMACAPKESPSPITTAEDVRSLTLELAEIRSKMDNVERTVLLSAEKQERKDQVLLDFKKCEKSCSDYHKVRSEGIKARYNASSPYDDEKVPDNVQKSLMDYMDKCYDKCYENAPPEVGREC